MCIYLHIIYNRQSNPREDSTKQIESKIIEYTNLFAGYRLHVLKKITNLV